MMSFLSKTRSWKLLVVFSAAVVVIAAVFLWLEMKNPAPAPTACNYNNPDKSYIKKDKGCVINFLCIQGRQAFSDECGCGCKVPDVPQPLNYSNSDYDFSFSYPERDVFKTDAGYQYVTNNSLARVDLPESDFVGTNLGEASFIVGASGDKKVIDACLKPAPEEKSTTSTENVNGTEMKVFDGVGVGAGNIYETKSYRAVKNGFCYEATLLMHSGNIGNYPPGTVKEFDHIKALNGLKDILNTFKIGDKAVSSLITEAEARKIAEKTCIKGGESLTPGYYNGNTKTWWFDANLNAVKEGCNPACVVSEETKTAEINWRCTGLIVP